MELNTELKRQTLKEWRHETGLTQRELAELAGVDKSSVAHVEQGLRSIKGRTARPIAAALDLHMSQIVEEPPKTPMSFKNSHSPDLPRKTLQSWRQQYSLSLGDLAVLAQLQPDTLRRIENGSLDNKRPIRNVRITTRIKLARALGIPVGNLIVPGDNTPTPTVTEESLEALLRSELRGARRALRKAYDFLRHDPNISHRALDQRDAILPDIERETKGL